MVTKVKPKKKRRGKGPLIAVLVVFALFLLPQMFSSPEDSPPRGPSEDQTDGDIPPVQDETEEDVPSPEEELLAVLDEAEESLDRTFDEYYELEPVVEDGVINDLQAFFDSRRQQNQTLGSFLTELEELRGRAAAAGVQDPKLKGAGDEYFTMMRDAMTAYMRADAFLWNCEDLYYNILTLRPVEADYDADQYSQYSEDLSAWAQTARTFYDSISCPSCAESEWEQYGVLLEYNQSIAEKVALAVEYGDWLRLYSARNMTSRYLTLEPNRYGKLVDCVNSEIHLAGDQGRTASALVEELHAYCDMTPEEKDAYEFQNIREGTLMLDYEVTNVIYPSLYNTYDAFAIIKAGCYSGTKDIVVEAEIDGFTQQYRQSFTVDSAYRAIYVKPPALTGQLDLTSAKDAQLKITVYEKDGSLIETNTFKVTLKSKYDFEWYSNEYGMSTQDNILCFLTPESSKIADLKVLAANQINQITVGSVKSFWGYLPVNDEWNQYLSTYLQAAGLMSALHEKGVVYIMNAFSLSGSNQHITFPDDVLTNGAGLCVETSLVVASALQSAGMHVFLVFPRGHAMVAVEVWDRGENAGGYFLVETTAIEASGNIGMFNESATYLLNGYLPGTWDHEGYELQEPVEYVSRDKWADYAENYFDYIIDCADSRLLGLTPFAN